MALNKILLFTEESSNNTYFRVDPNTLEVVADASPETATVFLNNAPPASFENTYQLADNLRLYMAKRSDNVIVVIETDSPLPETIFTQGKAHGGERPDDYYLLADNGLMITRNTSTSVMTASGDPSLNPTPKNSVIEGQGVFDD